MYNGVINVYKESGFTSFDVVAKLRGILQQKKIGHTGTLDPDAEGVLVVCLGKATKLVSVLTDKDKSYVATLLLGVTTDTEDVSGTVLTRQEVNVSEEEVRDAILSFVGEYDQIPPMYSAIKVNGKKLYELARNGEVVERKARRVAIHGIEILEMNLPRVTVRVSCGKGTYIRSLCRDIGERLSVGGVMEHLLRDSVTSDGTGRSFDVEDALTLARIEELVKCGAIEDYILPVDAMFPNLTRLSVNPAGDKKLQNGNYLTVRDFSWEQEGELRFERGAEYLIYDSEGTFRAVYRQDEKSGMLKADKMF